MRGNVVSLSVAAGQRMSRGDRPDAIQAMNMETAVFADVEGVVEEVVAGIGTHVDANDLLLVIEAAGAGVGGAGGRLTRQRPEGATAGR